MKDLAELQRFLNMNKKIVQDLMDSGHQLVAHPEFYFFMAVSGQHDPFTSCAGVPYHFFLTEDDIDNFFRPDNLI